MGTILVTGATGNVGGSVAQHLIAAGQSVRVAGGEMTALRARFGEIAEAVEFDFTDATTFDAALRDVDAVFLMRPPQLGKPEDLLPFVEALRQLGGMRMVSFLSLLGVERNPLPPHHKIEKYIEKAGLPFCHIRPSFFMQNLSGVHAFEIKHFDRIVVPVGHALTSFIDAEDIGAIAARALSEPEAHRYRAYSITGPEAIDYYTVAQILSEVLQRPIHYAKPDPRLAKRYWIEVRGLDVEYASVMGMLYLMTRMGTAKRVTTTFAEVMGREPRTFRDFAEKNSAAWL